MFNNTAFGNTAFGNPTNNTAFGNPTNTAFGNPTNNTAFGNPTNTAFGNPPTNTAFGNPIVTPSGPYAKYVNEKLVVFDFETCPDEFKLTTDATSDKKVGDLIVCKSGNQFLITYNQFQSCLAPRKLNDSLEIIIKDIVSCLEYIQHEILQLCIENNIDINVINGKVKTYIYFQHTLHSLIISNDKSTYDKFNYSLNDVLNYVRVSSQYRDVSRVLEQEFVWNFNTNKVCEGIQNLLKTTTNNIKIIISKKDYLAGKPDITKYTVQPQQPQQPVNNFNAFAQQPQQQPQPVNNFNAFAQQPQQPQQQPVNNFNGFAQQPQQPQQQPVNNFNAFAQQPQQPQQQPVNNFNGFAQQPQQQPVNNFNGFAQQPQQQPVNNFNGFAQQPQQPVNNFNGFAQQPQQPNPFNAFQAFGK